MSFAFANESIYGEDRSSPSYGEYFGQKILLPRQCFRLLILLNIHHLYVERKMFDVDGACRLEYCRRNPQHVTVVRNDGHCFTMFFQSSISTAHTYTNHCALMYSP